MILIEDWYLYNQVSKGFISRDSYTGQEFCDSRQEGKAFRLVGTKEQISKDIPEDWVLDEVYGYEKIAKDSYWDGICCAPNSYKLPTRAEYNKKWTKDYARYKEMYKANGSKLLILRTN